MAHLIRAIMNNNDLAPKTRGKDNQRLLDFPWRLFRFLKNKNCEFRKIRVAKLEK